MSLESRLGWFGRTSSVVIRNILAMAGIGARLTHNSQSISITRPSPHPPLSLSSSSAKITFIFLTRPPLSVSFSLLLLLPLAQTQSSEVGRLIHKITTLASTQLSSAAVAIAVVLCVPVPSISENVFGLFAHDSSSSSYDDIWRDREPTSMGQTRLARCCRCC